ncbi:MAG TPA: helix-turn-helix domain-containing protein [Candidatus Jeotgalibaca merdavium]|uniref:Helix-turn-helix domain-containing protein n=1 Tax=Candidatus Jeotgalibaca merdavium TaxID=2838627 RepID=A0A9D2KYL1_9LACT|nr:helix-turn-helix domain-containing protein [Candidatus Jeotgalibaca merdavium]
MEMNVVLSQEQSNQLKQYVFEITREGIEEARNSAKLDKPFLRQKFMAEWLGISVNTLIKLESEGLPSIPINGLKFFSKEEVSKWLMQRQK